MGQVDWAQIRTRTSQCRRWTDPVWHPGGRGAGNGAEHEVQSQEVAKERLTGRRRQGWVVQKDREPQSLVLGYAQADNIVIHMIIIIIYWDLL